MRQAECRVKSGLYAVFRVSQLVGMAPVRFTRETNDWRMQTARRHNLLVYFTMGLLAIGTLKTTILNFDYTREELHGRKQFLGGFTYRGMIFIVLIAACFAVYGAPRRVRAIVESLEELQKVSSQIDCKVSEDSSEKKKCLLIVFLCIVKIITFTAYLLSLIEAKDATFINVLTWFINYCLIVLLVFLMLQFAFPAVEIYTAYKLINDVLENVLLLSEHVCRQTFKLGNKRIRGANSAEDTINHLATMHSIVGDVTKKIGNANGFGVLLILIVILTHLIFMAYSVIMFFAAQGPFDIYWLLPTICWMFMLVVWAVVLIEPCHRTEYEIARTSILLCKLSLKHMHEAAAAEIQNFFRSVLLNKVVYAPLGLCELRRSFIAGIVTSVSSYLIIIFQFRSLE